MEINFTGHKMEVTPALKAFTQEKLGKLEKHFDKITAIHVVLEVDKLQQKADATVHIARAELHASAEAEDMYSAIDLLADKLDRQLIKHKEKIREHRE
ncbi:MAG: ribosome hibernation-promoting factor, HPF/YfiA family [Legionella sp.]